MHYSIWIYPWDLLDEGVDDVLKLLSDAGLNAVSVASSYHAGKFIRPHNPASAGKVYFPEDGVVYFRPHMKFYECTPIKPRLSSLAKKEDLFEYLPEKTKERGMKLVAWTVCLHNSELGRAYPEYTVRNAFGDSYVYNLCPSHAEVREYVKALAGDIASNYDFDAIELETPGFLSFEHGFHHEMYGLELPPGISLLLSLCFCRGCTQSARERGIDIDGIRKEVKERLNGFFQKERPEVVSLDADLLQWFLSGEEFNKYRAFRCSLVSELIREVKEVLPPDVELFVIPALGRGCTSAWMEGADIESLATLADAVEILSYFHKGKDVHADVALAKKIMGSKCRLHVGLRACWPETTSADDLAEKVKSAREVGVDGFSFYNYGHMRRANLEWIKQALKAHR